MAKWNVIPLGHKQTCAVVLADVDDVRCELRVGHGGAHEQTSVRRSARITTWWYDEQASPRRVDLRRVGGQ